MDRTQIVWNSKAPLQQQTELARYVLEGLPQIANLVRSAETLLEKYTWRQDRGLRLV